MSTSAVEFRPRAQEISFTEDELIVFLADGRALHVPLVWFPRLARASRSELENYVLLGEGDGIHWPDIDEDLSVEGLLRGTH